MQDKEQETQEGIAIRRAIKAMTCLPFKKAFYKELDRRAVSSTELCERSDVEQLSFYTLNAGKTEDFFIWMIQLGILRREVDGQGLTSRVRLTPMGRKVLDRISGEIQRAGKRRRLIEVIKRRIFV